MYKEALSERVAFNFLKKLRNRIRGKQSPIKKWDTGGFLGRLTYNSSSNQWMGIKQVRGDRLSVWLIPSGEEALVPGDDISGAEDIFSKIINGLKKYKELTARDLWKREKGWILGEGQQVIQEHDSTFNPADVPHSLKELFSRMIPIEIWVSDNGSGALVYKEMEILGGQKIISTITKSGRYKGYALER